MKFLDPTQATDTAQQPVKNGTLQFLQDAHKENLAALIIGLLGGPLPNGTYDTSKLYVLWGCHSTATFVNNTIVIQYGPGEIFYNGEVFGFAGSTVSLINSDVPVFSIVTAQYMPVAPLQADPVLFTDGVSRQVHNIRTIQVALGPAGGAGVTNYIGDWTDTVIPEIDVAAESADRVAGDNALQAEINILNGKVGAVPNNTSLQTEITTLQNTTNSQANQIAAIGTGWQDVVPTLINAGTTSDHISWQIEPANWQSGSEGTMHVAFSFATTPTAVNAFGIILPQGAKTGPNYYGESFVFVNNGSHVARVYASPGNNFIQIGTTDGGTFGTTQTFFAGSITIQIK